VVAFFRELADLSRHGGFRRLFGVRLASQFSDGVFQVALAGFVIFSPERAPSAGAIAVALAILLLPYSLVGPFAGVLLDRWSRRGILVVSNLIRAVMGAGVAGVIAIDAVDWRLTSLVLVMFAVNRFLLAGLSASLPHVVEADRLVMANAVTPTCGTMANLVGTAAGGLVHEFGSDVAVAACACLGFVAAGALALRLPFLGPDLADASVAVRAAMRNVVRGLVDGVRHLSPPSRLGLGVIAAHRLGFGLVLVATALLFRTVLSGGGTGLGGFALAVSATGLGFAVAAVTMPRLIHSIGIPRSIVSVLVLSACAVLVAAPWFTRPAVVSAAFLMGISAQGLKICVDTVVQLSVDDVHRGRAFAFYDMVFNVVFVTAAALATVVLPSTGRSTAVMLALGGWYLLIAFTFARVWRARVGELAAGMAQQGGDHLMADGRRMST
jgi:MFS family permease